MGFGLSASDYANLKNNANALTNFVNAAANAFAAKLRSQSGASSVSVSGTADPLSRRRLLQAGTVNINFVITFPTGTSATAVDAAVASVVQQVNAQGVSALGVTSLSGITPTSVTATVTTSRSTGEGVCVCVCPRSLSHMVHTSSTASGSAITLTCTHLICTCTCCDDPVEHTLCLHLLSFLLPAGGSYPPPPPGSYVCNGNSCNYVTDDDDGDRNRRIRLGLGIGLGLGLGLILIAVGAVLLVMRMRKSQPVAPASNVA
jgi:hypothetical protein